MRFLGAKEVRGLGLKIRTNKLAFRKVVNILIADIWETYVLLSSVYGLV